MIQTRAVLGRHGAQSRASGVAALTVWCLAQTQSEERLGLLSEGMCGDVERFLRSSGDMKPLRGWACSVAESNCRGDGRANTAEKPKPRSTCRAPVT